MRTQAAPQTTEQEARQSELLRLHWQLVQLGVRVSVRKPRNGKWKLRLYAPGWSETVQCAGAEGAYAYVTAHGRLLGSTDDVRHIARVLHWMIEGRYR